MLWLNCYSDSTDPSVDLYLVIMNMSSKFETTARLHTNLHRHMTQLSHDKGFPPDRPKPSNWKQIGPKQIWFW